MTDQADKITKINALTQLNYALALDRLVDASIQFAGYDPSDSWSGYRRARCRVPTLDVFGKVAMTQVASQLIPVPANTP